MQAEKRIIGYKFIAIIICLIVCFSACKQRRTIDWRPTFQNSHTIPYGTYIAYELLDSVFPSVKKKATRLPIEEVIEKRIGSFDGKYNEISETYLFDPQTENDRGVCKLYEDDVVETPYSYIFIQKKFTIYNTDKDALLSFVGRGNNVFIAAENIDSDLLDVLYISQAECEKTALDTTLILVDYPDKEYPIMSFPLTSHFINLKKSPYPVTTLAQNKRQNSVFIKVKYGYGYFYLLTTPTAFANINLLETDVYDYAFRSFSYMPDVGEIIWDESQTKGASSGRESDAGNSRSMFKVIFEHESLTIAFWIILSGLLLFMIFRAKRTQRIIPVIEKPSNTTIAFMDTLSTMYFTKKDYTSSMERRHAYFLDTIRTDFFMSTNKIDAKFIEQLSAKSGVSQFVLKDIFSYYNDMRVNGTTTGTIYIDYNKVLETFYITAKNKK